MSISNHWHVHGRAQLSGTILNTDFVYVANTDLKTEYLNSSLICTAIKVEVRYPFTMSEGMRCM